MLKWMILICAVSGVAPTQDSSPRVHSRGKSVIFNLLAVDVEVDGVTGYVDYEDGSPLHPHVSFKGSDFWFEIVRKRRYFNPQHGALLTFGSVSGMGFEGCSKASYAKGKLRIDDLPLGTSICVLSNEGRFSEVRIESFDPKSTALVLTWITWEKQIQDAGGKPPH